MADVVATTPATIIFCVRPLVGQARTSFFWMVAVAFALRFGWILVAHTYKFKTLDDNFSFGWEMGRIGRSLALGQGFSNPFNTTHGPTAWEPPLYPFLIAGVFKLFGIYTHASALSSAGPQQFFFRANLHPNFPDRQTMFRRETGDLDSLALGSNAARHVLVYPLGVGNEPGGAAAGAHFLAGPRPGRTRRAEAVARVRAVVGNRGAYQHFPAGVSAGFRIVGVVPALEARQVFAGRSGAGVAGIRRLHYSVDRAKLPHSWTINALRSNFGAELRIGNGPGADGTWREYLHPTQNVYQMQLYRRLGEITYVAERQREAIAFIREDYGRFIWLNLKRFIYYWGGVPRLSEIPALAPIKNSVFLASSVLAFWGLGRALRQRRHGAWLFFWLILSYPAVYYAVFPHPRYRHPIEPELGILMVYVVSEAQKSKPPSAEG